MNIYVFTRRKIRPWDDSLIGAVVVSETREVARNLLREGHHVADGELKKEFDVELLSRYTGPKKTAFVVETANGSA